MISKLILQIIIHKFNMLILLKFLVLHFPLYIIYHPLINTYKHKPSASPKDCHEFPSFIASYPNKSKAYSQRPPAWIHSAQHTAPAKPYHFPQRNAMTNNNKRHIFTNLKRGYTVQINRQPKNAPAQKMRGESYDSVSVFCFF